MYIYDSKVKRCIRGVAIAVFFCVSTFFFLRYSLSQGTDDRFDLERLEREFQNPPREFTLMPFWFWNDDLTKEKIASQIADFENHGVYGFTIHPRIGLPEDTGWMSQKLIDAMRFALEEARKRNMFVLLYDEGMYPSGSSAGQVVAEDPSFAARGFIKLDLDSDGTPRDKTIRIGDDWNFVSEYDLPDGGKAAVYDAPSHGVIRGLHYLGDESKRPGEFSPPASDLLNPEAVDAFIRLVYQRFYDEFEDFFRDGVVVGIFTDEPSILGRGPQRGMKEGNLKSLPTINKYLGYDFKPHLLELWQNVDSESPGRRAQYHKATRLALEEIYYGRISKWCVEHNTKLCGHPESSTDVGVLRKFQIPGQDIVWRYIEPGEKAFDPTHSPLAKAASSAAIHNGSRRNLNEVFGAYGHEFTYDEMEWLINWCVVRGQNLFVPHAFYYSIRGPRWEERPPDVGPNSPWWGEYKIFADYCARLSWLNTDSETVAPTAILVDSDRATTYGVRPLFENQLDFNYLEFRALIEDSEVTDEGLLVKAKSQDVVQKTILYRTLVVTPNGTPPDSCDDKLHALAEKGRVLYLGSSTQLPPNAKQARNDAEEVAAIRETSGSDVEIVYGDGKGLRARHVVKGNVDFYFLFNEIEKPLEVTVTFGADSLGRVRRWNPKTGVIESVDRDAKNGREFALKLNPHETTVLGFER